MIRVAIISCDHGLGHVRRCYLLARELLSGGSRVDLYAPMAKVSRMREVLGPTTGLHTVDFSTRTTPKDLRAGATDSLQWQLRLPNLDGYDLVISDTLPEILERRPDAVLLAQFFWHDVLDGLPPSYQQRCAVLLDEAQPRIFGSALFAMPAVRNQPGFKPVGLYGPDKPRPDLHTHRDALLVSPGSTALARTVFSRLVAMLTDQPRITAKTIYVDPGVLPSTHPVWIRPSDYSETVYRRTLATVCRPGLGVLTDALWHGVIPICLDIDSNREMMNNARVVARERLGYICDTLECALRVLSSLTRPLDESDHMERLATADFRAAQEIAELLAKPTGRSVEA